MCSQNKYHKRHQDEAGFSLLELMICLAIVSILTILALPNYHHYLKKAYYLELVQMAMPYKLAVATCFQEGGDLLSCNGGEHDIPQDKDNLSSTIERIETIEGKIHVVPRAIHGFKSDDDYWLIPEIKSGQIDWHTEGQGVKKDYGR